MPHLSLSLGVGVDPCWLAAGALLHVSSAALRSRAWFNILRACYPGAQRLRARDAMAAVFAGAGMNGLLPARGGDVVKLAFVHRRIPGARYSTLTGTAVPETTFESLCGAALVVWMLAQGVAPASGCAIGGLAAILLSFVVLAAVVGASGRLRRRAAPVVRRFRHGLAILGTPTRFVKQVASWQALARLVRLTSLACFLAAFGLPVTLGAALLVMAVQGGGSVVPIAGASAGLRIAMLSQGLGQVTGQPVDVSTITGLTIGMSATTFVVMLAIATALVARELGTCTPLRALRRARTRVHAGVPSPIPALDNAYGSARQPV